MPLSHLRRPLALAAFSYMLLLALLRSWGLLRERSCAPWLPHVRAPCARVEGRVASGFTENRLGERVRVEASGAADCAEAGPHPAPLPPLVLFAYLPRGHPLNSTLRPGMRVAFEGALRLPRRPLNPGEYDERQALADRGITLVLHARRLEILDARIPARRLLRAWAEGAHRSIHRVLQSTYPPHTAGVLEGILLGYKGVLDPGLERAVRDAGAMHLLVPSGSNVAFLVGALLWSAGLFGLGRWAAYALACAACGFYGLVVGTDPPFLRAYLSAFAGFAFRSLDRGPAGFQALVLSAMVILLVQPRALFMIGFQMSYLTVLGLLIALPRWRLPPRWSAAARTAVLALLMSLVSQLALAPVLAAAFGRVSLAGLLANAVLVPLSGLMLGAGFAVWGLSLLPWSPPFTASAWLLGALVWLFCSVCRLCARLPAAAVSAVPLGPVWTAAFYLLALAVLLLPDRKAALRLAFAGSLAAFGACAWGGLSPARARLVFMSQGRRSVVFASLPGIGDRLIGPGLAPAATERALRSLQARRPGRVRLGKTVLSLDIPPLQIALARGWAVVRRAGEGGPPEFCILLAPAMKPPEACAQARVYDTRKEGAVWVETDGTRWRTATQRQLHTIGRSVL